jgi:2-dehydropantoate 2-reductase
MGKQIAVIGAGAIGSAVSADLIKAGLDVMIIDQWPAHVEAMKTVGLCVSMKGEVGYYTVPVRALHLCELASSNVLFDIVFLAAKSNDTRWLTELICPYLKEDGVLAGLQNGMNDDAIASIVGRARTVGAVVELQAELFNPGQIQRNTTHDGTWFSVGELDGTVTPRIEEIADIIRQVGRCAVTENIYGAKWTKLIANIMTMAAFGLFGLRNYEAAALPGMQEISVKLGREALSVGTALGYRIEPIFGMAADEFSGSSDENLVKAMKTLMSHVGGGRTAPIHDHIKGRRSEMAYIPGLVSCTGRELGIPTPFNDAVVELDRRINRGELKMEPANFERLKAMVSSR